MRMSMIAAALLAAQLGTAALPARAEAQNPLSVHVLDLQTGQPSPGIQVDL